MDERWEGQLKGVILDWRVSRSSIHTHFILKYRINHAQAEAEHGETPMKVARSSAAWDVVQALLPYYT